MLIPPFWSTMNKVGIIKNPTWMVIPFFQTPVSILFQYDAPKDLTLVASGVEIERTDTSDRQKILVADGPARDFYLVASSDFHKQSGQIGDVTINSYTLTQSDRLCAVHPRYG